MFTQTKQNGSRTGFGPVLLVVFILSFLSFFIFPGRRAATGRLTTRLVLSLAEWLGAAMHLGSNFITWLSGLVIRLGAGFYRHSRTRLVDLSLREKVLSTCLIIAAVSLLMTVTHPSHVTPAPSKSHPSYPAGNRSRRKEKVQ